jgi:hypothetical protein
MAVAEFSVGCCLEAAGLAASDAARCADFCWVLPALLPWAWRNHNVTGHWIFTSLWSGPSLYDGLHPGATGASDMTFVDTENVFSKMSEYDTNAHYKQRAFEFALNNPAANRSNWRF